MAKEKKEDRLRINLLREQVKEHRNRLERVGTELLNAMELINTLQVHRPLIVVYGSYGQHLSLTVFSSAFERHLHGSITIQMPVYMSSLN